MSVRADSAIQTKVWELLTADATLETLLGGSGRILENVLGDSVYPYVVIGEMELTDWGSHTHSGFQGDLTIHSWIQGLGRKYCQDIMSRVYALLHNIDLALTGFPTIKCRCEFGSVVVEDDNRTFHGIQRFGLIIGGNN